MKRFLITYKRNESSETEWHKHVQDFIAAIDADADLKGKITYRCMKAKDGTAYYHLAEVHDEAAGKALQTREFFQRYTAETKRVAGGSVDVLPLDVVAQTM